MCRKSCVFIWLVLVTSLAGTAVAQEIYYWTNASGDGMWNRDTAPYNWAKVPAWNPTGPQTPCPPPGPTSGDLWLTGSTITRAMPVVIPAGYDANCTNGSTYGTIYGPEWGLHLDVYGKLNVEWTMAPVQAVEGLIDPCAPDNDPNRSVINMYGDSVLYGPYEGRVEALCLGLSWWMALPYVDLNLYDNSFVYTNSVILGGHINLYGGTLDVLNYLQVGTRDTWTVPDNLVRINVEEGTLLLPFDYADEVEDWINRGILTAYGTTPGPGASAILVDTTTIENRTVVTALPITPPEAFRPSPRNGAKNIQINPTLRWMVGTYAAGHNVYLGTDANAVENADATSDPSVTFAPVDVANFAPAVLDHNETYYWRVDEVNDANVVKRWKGPVWSFTTGNFRVVDDFETYTNDVSNRVFQTWLDGLGYTEPVEVAGNGTGAVVGYDPSFGNVMETDPTLVHGGKQSMPLAYDNTGTATVSEAQRTWNEVQEWNHDGATTLVLYIMGKVGNVADDLYVRIADDLGASKAVLNTDPSVLIGAEWKEWAIPLSQFNGVDMARVKSMTIGLGSTTSPKHGAGMILIDDITVQRLP